MGHATYFLGVEITHTTNRIILSQEKYDVDILRDAGIMNATATSSLVSHGLDQTEPGTPM